MRGGEPGARALKFVLRYPHHAAAELKQRERKRRDPTITFLTLVEVALRGGGLTALRVKRSQRPEANRNRLVAPRRRGRS